MSRFHVICISALASFSSFSVHAQNPWGTAQYVDIGAVGVPGSVTNVGGVIEVKSSGSDIWGTADSFGFLYGQLAGNGQISFYLSDFDAADAWAKAGPMVRTGLQPSAANVMLAARSNAGVFLQHRPTSSGNTALQSTPAMDSALVPVGLRLRREGDTFKSYSTSNNKDCWEEHLSQTINNAPSTMFYGLAVTSHANQTLGIAQATDFKIESAALPVNVLCTNSFTSKWIGPAATGAAYAYYDKGNYHLRGAGTDIWGTADNFQYLYKTLTGDGEITVKLESMSNTDSWAKFGPMVRTSDQPGAANLMFAIRPTEGSMFQYRLQSGGSTASKSQMETSYLGFKRWLKLRRVGNVITAYVSDDKQCWVTRDGYKQNIAGWPSTLQYGIALTSHNTSVFANATATGLEVGPLTVINQACPEANLDGRYQKPTEWVLPPGNTGDVQWRYTFTNPQPYGSFQRCYNEWSEGYADSDDHPDCVRDNHSPAWAKPGFSVPSSWNTGHLGLGKDPVGTFGWAVDDRVRSVMTGDSAWLRTTFQLSSQDQINNLVFWGRWTKGATIYINGVKALSNRGGVHQYRYFSMSQAARNALVLGTNTIAVRVAGAEWKDGQKIIFPDRYFDIGLTRKSEIANIAVTPVVPTSDPKLLTFVNRIKQKMQEQGITGSIFGFSSNEVTVANYSFGYKSPKLNATLPANAILRLASNDKPITRAIVAQMISDGDFNLSMETPVVAYLRDELGFTIQPVPGQTGLGQYVDEIKIKHLFFGESHLQSIDFLDQMLLRFNITPSEWTPEHRIRWVFSKPTVHRPGALETDPQGNPRPIRSYSNEANTVLRFVAAKALAVKQSGKTLNQYIMENMSLPGVKVAFHKEIGRNGPLDAGYFLQDNFDYHDVTFEDQYVLASDVEGFLRYTDNYPMDYAIDMNSQLIFGDGKGHSGAMDGSVSQVLHDRENKRALIWTASMYGSFGEIGDWLHEKFYQPNCTWKNILQNPKADLSKRYYIRNYWRPENYLNQQIRGTGAPSGFLYAGPIKGDWWGPLWTIAEVPSHPGKYTINGDWNGDKFFYVDTQNSNKLKLGNPTHLPANVKHFEILPVSPENPSLHRYRIKSVAVPNMVVSTRLQQVTDNGPIFDVMNGNIYQPHMDATFDNYSEWMFCAGERK